MESHYKESMTEPLLKDQVIMLRVNVEWLETIDRWRRDKAQREERDVSRSEAIRVLVSEGIAE